ncbi:hypothetical protein [Streptosporangium sp. NPDC006930]|uniref:hypothetical protein n=1 Tax=Streptosporangium sp. NPDC006930 TaxID=3154783 RepID=UPI00341418E6
MSAESGFERVRQSSVGDDQFAAQVEDAHLAVIESESVADLGLDPVVDDAVTCLIGSTGTGAESVSVSLACLTLGPGPATTETVTWTDATGGTSTIAWNVPILVTATATATGTVTAGRYLGDAATRVTSGISYYTSLSGCLLGHRPHLLGHRPRRQPPAHRLNGLRCRGAALGRAGETHWK